MIRFIYGIEKPDVFGDEELVNVDMFMDEIPNISFRLDLSKNSLSFLNQSKVGDDPGVGEQMLQTVFFQKQWSLYVSFDTSDVHFQDTKTRPFRGISSKPEVHRHRGRVKTL